MNPSNSTRAYRVAQRAMADLKAAVHMVLSEAADGGLSNAEVGRMLGIYLGHKGHEGHISRTALGIMETEGVVSQNDKSKKWSLSSSGIPSNSERSEA